MKHLYRLFTATLITSLIFGVAYQDQNIKLHLGYILSSITFLSVLSTLYLKEWTLSFQQRLPSISIGVLLGLLSAYFLSHLFTLVSLNSYTFYVLSYLLSLFFFLFISYNYNLGIVSETSVESKKNNNQGIKPKLLDTSVIIDGRIMDIAETKFVEGPFIVPNYVLREIQLISDSADGIKRNRGRRGLDMLNKLREREDIEVKISYQDYTDIREVDAKLIRSARETNAYLVTNDFNLNKVASLQNVEVLNLNNLTTALKPVVLPGENIIIDILREGKDENQGIGYLEDGTMVVVEDGGNLMNKKVEVNVASVIQTAAGKMIFTKANKVIDDSDVETKQETHSNNGNNNRRGGRKRSNSRSRR